MKYVHPFPARMAPELALEAISRLTLPSKVLDPMMGSGTVLEEAAKQGHHAVGLDIDPLALLMTNVRLTKSIDADKVTEEVERCASYINRWKDSSVSVPWIDADEETLEFVKYWYGKEQLVAMRALARYLWRIAPGRLSSSELDLFKLGLSKIVVVKSYGASLAWDVSHSRPHIKIDEAEHDFDVAAELKRAVMAVSKVISKRQLAGTHTTRLGDARAMRGVLDDSIDLVVTSPPYFNAIDYMRGHRLALVWMGFTLKQLRAIRGDSVGAERGLGTIRGEAEALVSAVSGASTPASSISQSLGRKVARYSADTLLYLDRISKVLKKDGEAVFVVGNCRIKGITIDNSRSLEVAAKALGFSLVSSSTRDLPDSLRYLPTPASNSSPLFMRMRQESVIRLSRGNAVGLTKDVVRGLKSSVYQ